MEGRILGPNDSPVEGCSVSLLDMQAALESVQKSSLGDVPRFPFAAEGQALTPCRPSFRSST